ncbi:MAG: four-carbon acid sugar kinase family protein [Vulcanimicrobiaceae bacterium]
MPRYLVADDLTGACDAALAYAKRGALAVAWLDATLAPAGDAEILAADIIAIDLDSRAETPERAYARMSALLERVRPQRPCDVVQKMDSTLRGNVGAELRALLAYFTDAVALVAPSFPSQGRAICDGALVVQGSVVSASAIAPRLACASVGIGLKTVRAGETAIAAAIGAVRESGARVAIVDAETDADLRALVSAAGGREDVLWVGSAGLCESLASAELGAAPVPTAGRIGATLARRVLFLIGSRHAVTRAQIRSFAVTVPAEAIEPNALLSGNGDVAAAIARGAAALDACGTALVAIGGDSSLDDARLAAAFVAAAAPLVRDRNDVTVVLSGGDIARAFCEAFGIRGLSIRDELAAGIPRSRAIGAPFDLVTKAGGFGTPDTYQELRRVLHESTTA